MKNILLFALVFIIVSCKQNEEKPLFQNNFAQNEKIARELFIHFNNHDWRKMANLYSEKAEFKEPASGMVRTKRQKSKL
jgi:hypothetical protein